MTIGDTGGSILGPSIFLVYDYSMVGGSPDLWGSGSPGFT